MPNRGGGKRGGWSDRQTNPAANGLKGVGGGEQKFEQGITFVDPR